MQLLRFCTGIFSVGIALQGAGLAFGQDYPTKTIRIIVGSVGGGSDRTARLIAQGISGPLGQPVIVEARGSALIAAEAGAKAPPDGYNLLVAGAGTWLLPLYVEKSPYEMREFAPVSLISREVNVLVVHPSLPVTTTKELIALAKAKPGELNYAGTAAGTIFLAGALFRSMAGVKITNVPYKGTALAITSLLSGETQISILDAGGLSTHLKSGKLKALGVTSATPSTLTPGMPTVAASGLPGYEFVGVTVILAPAKTPTPIISRLNQEIVRVLNTPESKERMLSYGSEVMATSAEQLASVIRSDTAKMEKVIKEAGIKTD